MFGFKILLSICLWYMIPQLKICLILWIGKVKLLNNTMYKNNSVINTKSLQILHHVTFMNDAITYYFYRVKNCLSLCKYSVSWTNSFNFILHITKSQGRPPRSNQEAPSKPPGSLKENRFMKTNWLYLF